MLLFARRMADGAFQIVVHRETLGCGCADDICEPCSGINTYYVNPMDRVCQCTNPFCQGYDIYAWMHDMRVRGYDVVSEMKQLMLVNQRLAQLIDM